MRCAAGNLVGPASWEHFWLNEGWTVWLERRIGASLEGEQWYEFSAAESSASLEEAISAYGEGHNFTSLVPDLSGMDPDDAFSVIPCAEHRASLCVWPAHRLRLQKQ